MITTNPIHLLMEESEIYSFSDNGKRRVNISDLVGNLAYHSMMLEAHLTPKAGLVDCLSSGAHTDMDISTFIESSAALRPHMKKFVSAGYKYHNVPAHKLLPVLRQVGLDADKAMSQATNGINTHKGMIFTLGLICGSVGWLYGNAKAFNALNVRQTIISACSTLINDDFKVAKRAPMSAGERIFAAYGLTGIRGEAAKGYPTIFDFGLVSYRAAIESGHSEEQALSYTLLVLMANNSDTNLIHRGGLDGLKYVQQHAKRILDSNKEGQTLDFEHEIVQLDTLLIKRNLSPGGSADLLAATWLLSQLDSMQRS